MIKRQRKSMQAMYMIRKEVHETAKREDHDNPDGALATYLFSSTAQVA